MYYGMVIGLMLVLPALSTLIELWLHPDLAIIAVAGRWFVFWGIGVRLFLAGIHQAAKPEYTARDILQIKDPDASKVVVELGFANVSLGLIGMLSVFLPGWTAPAALAGGLFLGLDGIKHIQNRDRNAVENTAMVSDLFLAAICVIYLLWWLTV